MKRPDDDLPEEPGAPEADALMRALPPAPIDRAFSARVLRATRAELRVGAAGGAWHRAGRFVGRVAVPAALVACAAGYVYHYVQVVERVYAAHDGAGL